MRIGLISDTHDHLEHVNLAMAQFRLRGVRRILHAGDMVRPPVVQAMAGFDVAGVLGNNDLDQAGLQAAFEAIGGWLPGDFLEMDAPVGTGRIALYHGWDARFLYGLIARGGYRVVVSGHTHRPRIEREGGTLVLNPGTAHGYGGRATVMVYDDAVGEAELIEL